MAALAPSVLIAVGFTTVMRFRWKLLALLAVSILFGAKTASAWDAPAHEIIAEIAYSQLDARTKQAVDELARELAAVGKPYDAITLSCWMDDLRNNDLPLPQHGLFYTWHYIDIGLDPADPRPSFQPGNDNPYNGNIVQALKRAYVVLAGGTDPYVTSRAMALAMTMHLVGDIHQPLHASTRYFETPGGWRHHDAGGNKTYVVNGPQDDPKFNLHQFWDSAWRASFDEATGRVVLDPRYQEYGSHRPAAIKFAAIDKVNAADVPNASLQPNFEGWAEESHRIATDFVYREITATESEKSCRLSSAYVARASTIACQRLNLAAQRLAVLLSQTLGPYASAHPPAPYPAGPPGRPYGSN
jgi:hypothetical protein